MKYFKYFALFVLGFGALLVIGFTCNWFSNAVSTAQKEFSPSAMLKKYEYFKELSAGIDAKRADIALYKEELKDYKIITNDDRFYLEQRKSELLGIIGVHNILCQKYNTGMAEFNYRFANKGDLPQTNLEPLPREYKPYVFSTK